MIKAHNAQRTKATVPLVKEARRAILLSGTPALNKPIEIFQQVCSVWAMRQGCTFAMNLSCVCDTAVLLPIMLAFPTAHAAFGAGA